MATVIKKNRQEGKEIRETETGRKASKQDEGKRERIEQFKMLVSLQNWNSCIKLVVFSKTQHMHTP